MALSPLRVTGAILWLTWRGMILALLTTALLFPPETSRGLRCIAVLASARDPAIADDAGFYTAIVGAEAMDATGLPREAIRDTILDQVRIVRRIKATSIERDQCVARMKARVARERVHAR